jgi:Uma2 family endonuclease
MLRDTLDERGSRLKLTFLEGELELMRPSPEHEDNNGLIGRLLAAWCVDRGIVVFGMGSTTYREERAARGLEPDEGYSFGTRKAIPDLAIEVVRSQWRVDKLEVYRGLGIREVWVLRDGLIHVHHLERGTYVVGDRSKVLPDLDLAILAQHVVPGTSLTAAMRAFRRAIADAS